MKNLGNSNLFSSDFIIGTAYCNVKNTKSNIIQIEVLHKWMDYKDSDWGMTKYRTERTQYISFLNLIDLQDLFLIIQDLMHIYKLQYPYATKEDFIETVFGFTIYDLGNFIKCEFTRYGKCPNVGDFHFYYTYQRISNEFIDFVLDHDKDFDYYKQYYKKVLQLIQDIQYNPIELGSLTYEHKEIESKSEQETPTFKNNIVNITSVEIYKFGSLTDEQKEIETKSEQETLTFKNNFDNISTVEVYEHFKAGLVEKGYLTEEELMQYLKAAFELLTVPEILFKIKDAPRKSAIEAVFYKYYKNVAGKIHGKQSQYAALLGNYFEGYKTNTVSSNFSKSVY